MKASIVNRIRREAIFCPTSALTEQGESVAVTAYAKAFVRLRQPHSLDQAFGFFADAYDAAKAEYVGRPGDHIAEESFNAITSRLWSATYDLMMDSHKAGS